MSLAAISNWFIIKVCFNINKPYQAEERVDLTWRIVRYIKNWFILYNNSVIKLSSNTTYYTLYFFDFRTDCKRCL